MPSKQKFFHKETQKLPKLCVIVQLLFQQTDSKTAKTMCDSSITITYL